MSKEIIEAIVAKDFNKAKGLIHESMNEKLGVLLEEKLEEYAPTIFEAKKTKDCKCKEEPCTCDDEK